MQNQHVQFCLNRGLRACLYDVAGRTGSTRWNDPIQRTDLQTQWRGLAELLRWHTATGVSHSPGKPLVSKRVIDDIEAEHRDLAGWVDELDGWFERLLIQPSNSSGQIFHHDLTLFTAELLRHLDAEETLSGQPPEWLPADPSSTPANTQLNAMSRHLLDIAIECTLPAIDDHERLELLQQVVGQRSDVTTEALLAIGERVLEHRDAVALRQALGDHPMADQ